MSRYKGRYNGGGKSNRRDMFKNQEEDTPDETPFIGDVNIDSVNSKVYLVKLPKNVYEKFTQSVPEGSAGPVLGRLRMNKKEQKLFIDGNPNGIEAYDIRFQNRAPKTTVFSYDQTGQDAALRAEGKVSHQCAVQPVMNEKLRISVRERTKKASIKTRTTLFMDEDTRRLADNEAMKPQSGIETMKQREERKRQKEAKRKHLDVPDDQWRELAKKAVFTAFEGQLMFTADMLAREVEEPLSKLRSIINELCVYNKSGVFAGHYTLKTDFMSVQQRDLHKLKMEEFGQLEFEKKVKRREERVAEERANKRSRKN